MNEPGNFLIEDNQCGGWVNEKRDETNTFFC